MFLFTDIIEKETQTGRSFDVNPIHSTCEPVCGKKSNLRFEIIWSFSLNCGYFMPILHPQHISKLIDLENCFCLRQKKFLFFPLLEV